MDAKTWILFNCLTATNEVFLLNVDLGLSRTLRLLWIPVGILCSVLLIIRFNLECQL